MADAAPRPGRCRDRRLPGALRGCRRCTAGRRARSSSRDRATRGMRRRRRRTGVDSSRISTSPPQCSTRSARAPGPGARQSDDDAARAGIGRCARRASDAHQRRVHRDRRPQDDRSLQLLLGVTARRVRPDRARLVARSASIRSAPCARGRLRSRPACCSCSRFRRPAGSRSCWSRPRRLPESRSPRSPRPPWCSRLAAFVLGRDACRSGFRSRLCALLTAFTLIAEQLVGAPLSDREPDQLLAAARRTLLRHGQRGRGDGVRRDADRRRAAARPVARCRGQRADAATLGYRGVLGAVFVGVAAAPFLGANVGVAIWGTAGFAVAWLLLQRPGGHGSSASRPSRCSSWSSSRSSRLSICSVGGEQTHLGRALAGAEQGGLGTLWTIVARKADANVRVLSTTGLTWILAAVVGLAVFARWRPGSDWPALLAENPHFAKAVTAATVAGVVGVLLGGLGCRRYPRSSRSMWAWRSRG